MAEDEHDAGMATPLTTEPSSAADSGDEGDGPKYGVHHLTAVVKPVALCMLIASWVVANIRQDAQDQAIQQGLSVYMVYNENSGGSTASKLGDAVINALVIVGAVCAITFVLVACYKYRCLKCMIAYLMFSSASLLGYSGGFVVQTAITIYGITISWPTFVFLMYNFAGVGVAAVFYQKGIPRVLTQAYLVSVSVIMAWIVTKFPEWTGWSLLVALAFYDLCAVLTPCGPLKALVKLAQERRDPIPGLVYEADVGGGDETRMDRVHDTLTGGKRKDGDAADVGPGDAASARGGYSSPPATVPTDGTDDTAAGVASGASGADATAGASADVAISVATDAAAAPVHPGDGEGHGEGGPVAAAEAGASDADVARAIAQEQALARDEALAIRVAHAADEDTGGGARGGDAADASPLVPPAADRQRQFAESERARAGQADADEEEPNSIKLGLGDFVFYSVLVSRGALFDVSTLAACFVGVLMGLVSTLVLLGVFQKALPALPISIMFGVVFYFSVRFMVNPYMMEFTMAGVYA